MRRFFTWMAFGALAGVIIATVLAPSVLRGLLATTGAKDAMCQCVELVNNTSALLIKTQLWGGAIGGVVLPVGAWFARRFWDRRQGGKNLPVQDVPPNRA